MKEGFRSIFRSFIEHRDLKIVFVGSASPGGKPNTAPKLLVDIEMPNAVYYLDHFFTSTYRNVRRNPQASVAFMDDHKFTGFRLTGSCRPLRPGAEFSRVHTAWEKRLNRYLAARIVERIKGEGEAGMAEMDLPKDFVIMKVAAREAALVKPDRVLKRRA